tara:strand:- start:1220 stop:1939 length:720 start_codon:yes stop_codon:yes gene_type:complete
MSSNDYGKWIGGIAGFMYGGVLGAFVGYHLGKTIGRNFGPKKKMFEMSFEMSLLVLATMVIRADGKIKKSELDCVRLFFIQSFGKKKSDIYFKVFNEIKAKPFPSVRSVCLEINKSVNHKTRLQIIHFLFSIAHSDGHIHSTEIDIIKKIAKYFWVSDYDFSSIEAMFLNKNKISNAYTILGLDENATDEEVKKAYRKIVKKYHPDRLTDVGEDVVRLAKEKFQAVQDAYSKIREKRGF